MGLLDWLDGVTGNGGPSPGSMSNPMGDMTGVNPMTAPPELPAPGAGLAGMQPGADMDPMSAGGTSAPGTPLPMARPPGADASATPPPLPPPINVPNAGAPDASMLPPNATPTMGQGLPPGPPMSLAAPGGGDAPQSSGAVGILGRALGMDANRERSFKGSIGAGLKAAGDSAGKSPFQAFASGAGSSLEGGQKADDKGYDQRLKSLQLAVAAKTGEDNAAYHKHYADYLGKKLANETAAAAGGGKGGSWNKPESQRFLDAQRAAATDPDVHASQTVLTGVVKNGSPEEVAAAQAKHADLVKQKQGQYLQGVGIDPQRAATMMSTPPGTPPIKGPDGNMTGGNPISVTSEKDFDIYVKPGQAYINPRDGKVYIRKGANPGQGGAPAAPTAPQPPAIPSSPTTDDSE